jgi:hypothetical protein
VMLLWKNHGKNCCCQNHQTTLGLWVEGRGHLDNQNRIYLSQESPAFYRAGVFHHCGTLIWLSWSIIHLMFPSPHEHLNNRPRSASNRCQG